MFTTANLNKEKKELQRIIGQIEQDVKNWIPGVLRISSSKGCIRYYHHLLDVIGDTARTHGVGQTALALAWTRQAGPDIVITGARNTTQLQENLNCDVELTQHEVLELDSAARELEEAGRKVCDNIFSYRW